MFVFCPYIITNVNCICLQLLQRVPKVHSFSVTSLCFVINKVDPPNKTAPPNELVISVSADRTCCVTKPKEKGKHFLCFSKLLNSIRYYYHFE